MKRLFAITSAVLIACTSLAFAQQATSTTKPLADVARQEEERRKTVRKPAKVYTNGNLRQDISAGVAAPPSAVTPAAAGNASPSNATPAAPAAAAPADQAAWAARMKTARDNMQRSQMFADSLQSRINALQTDFVNRDDPIQRSKIEQDKNAALAELEKVKKELVDQAKAIKDIEEEARRAGVPAGWLRPGA